MNTDQLKSLCLKVAPELAAGPLYVLRHDDDFPPPPANSCAYAQPVTVRPRLRDLLVERGQWKGPGPAIVLRDELPPNEEMAVLGHELAHLVPHKPPPPDVEPDEVEHFIDDLVIRHGAQGTLDDPTRPPWHPYHGKIFTRIAVHVWWRFAIFADIILPTDIAAGADYGVSHFYAYWRALDREALRMRAEDFRTILAIEPPQEFDELWHNDVTCWVEQHVEAEHRKPEPTARRTP